MSVRRPDSGPAPLPAHDDVGEAGAVETAPEPAEPAAGDAEAEAAKSDAPGAPEEDFIDHDAVRAQRLQRQCDEKCPGAEGPAHAAELKKYFDEDGNPDYGKLDSEARSRLKKGDVSGAKSLLDAAEKGWGLRGAQAVLRRQVEVFHAMKTAGVKVAPPHAPGPQQLEAYFETLKGKPEEARDAFEQVASAFYKHPGRDIDYTGVGYKVDGGTGKAGKAVYKTEDAARAAAGPDGSVVCAGFSAPRGWKDIEKQKKAEDGRTEIDCEGFAFLGAKLLGAAGFTKVEYANAERDAASDEKVVLEDGSEAKPPPRNHAMVRVSDGKNVIAVSNEKAVIKDASEKDAALREAAAAAYGSGESVSFHLGRTANEAQDRNASRARVP